MKQLKVVRKHFEIRFKHDPWPFDPRYPDAWRGETAVRMRIRNWSWKIRWAYRRCENDWRRQDTATRVNISPRWAKWFHLSSYYAGNFRNIWHLTLGRFGVSYLPVRDGVIDCTW